MIWNLGMADLSHSVAHGSALSARLMAVAADLKDRFARWKLYNQTLDELQSLSAAELADLGLSPANLRSVAYEAAYGK